MYPTAELQLVPPMTLNLLGSYLEERHPIAHLSWQKRAAMWSPDRNRSQEALIAQIKEGKPGAVFFYPHEERHNILWYGAGRVDGIITAYHQLQHLEAGDNELLSLLQLWKQVTAEWSERAGSLRPATRDELLSQLESFTHLGAECLRRRLQKDGIAPDIPLTKEHFVHTIHDNFSDDVSDMNDNDAILAWHLAVVMTCHLEQKTHPVVTG